jgi:hypothetical protein
LLVVLIPINHHRNLSVRRFIRADTSTRLGRKLQDFVVRTDEGEAIFLGTSVVISFQVRLHASRQFFIGNNGGGNQVCSRSAGDNVHEERL